MAFTSLLRLVESTGLIFFFEIVNLWLQENMLRGENWV